MMKTLKEIEIKGFKSIEHAKLTLCDLNVVIGANGSGKSNLIATFDLLKRVVSCELQSYVASDPDRLLHHGRKFTPKMSFTFASRNNTYSFDLMFKPETLVFGEERAIFHSNKEDYIRSLAKGHLESVLETEARKKTYSIQMYVLQLTSNLLVYHFHDTSDSSPVKRLVDLDDNRQFRADAANLPAFLYFMQEKHAADFRRIVEHIRLVAPFFERFNLAPSKLNEGKIKLEWRQAGSDAYFDAFSLSDGTLRFICLATLLLQPELPKLILLDEPELGLHPYAIRVLAEMLEAASKRTQVLIATQSVTLLNHFGAENVIVAENDGKKTTFSKLDSKNLGGWLEDYTLGELWEKNVLGGRP